LTRFYQLASQIIYSIALVSHGHIMETANTTKPTAFLPLHWWRLKRSLSRRWKEWRLPRGFERLGTKYGGWWIMSSAIRKNPLLIDCGLGNDISFTTAFLQQFGGRAIGIDPNPAAIEYCTQHSPPGMEIRPEAFWTKAGDTLTFHLPRPVSQLPKGADGVSGSLIASHTYAGDSALQVRTTSLDEILQAAHLTECDVLKLDIEGAEYEVLNDLCATGKVRMARQLLIEFHHHCTSHTLQDTLDAVAKVQSCGFNLCHTEDRNYIFLRQDIG
jgi:FkbM family methyltransferase